MLVPFTITDHLDALEDDTVPDRDTTAQQPVPLAVLSARLHTT